MRSVVAPGIVIVLLRVVVVVVRGERHADLVQAVQVVEDAELEVVMLFAGIADEGAVGRVELLRFGGGDGDVLVMEEGVPGGVERGAWGADVSCFGGGEGGVVELLRGGVEEKVVGEMLLDDFEGEGGVRGD